MNYHESFLEHDPYECLRGALAPEYAKLSPEQIEALIETTFGPGASAEDVEGIFGSVGNAFSHVGKTIGRVAKQTVPIVGRALRGMMQGAMAGSALGPFGMLLGAATGGAGSALGGQRGAAGAVGKVLNTGLGMAGTLGGGGLLGTARTGTSALAGSPTAQASPAAGQLLHLLGRPEVAQALQAMMLGSLGRQNIQVGATPVPVGAFANLLGMLANRAGSQAMAAAPAGKEGMPEYLLDESGEYCCDIANPEARAETLWNLLSQSEPAEAEEMNEADELAALQEAEDEVYDALELMEMAEMETEFAEDVL